MSHGTAYGFGLNITYHFEVEPGLVEVNGSPLFAGDHQIVNETYLVDAGRYESRVHGPERGEADLVPQRDVREQANEALVALI